jgi:hypothetical protein
MPDSLTPEALAELRRLHEAATQGEARPARMEATSLDAMLQEMRDAWLGHPDASQTVCMHVLIASGSEILSLCVTGNGPKGRENAWLIAALWNALPALLAAAEESIIECEGCAELRAALSGRTVSCAQCETLARERDELRRELTRISEEGHGGNTLLVGEVHELRAQRDALLTLVERAATDSCVTTSDDPGCFYCDHAEHTKQCQAAKAIRRARGEG